MSNACFAGALMARRSWAGRGVARFEPGGYSFPGDHLRVEALVGSVDDARLPIQLSALKELSLRYAVSTESTGKLNLAAAVWLTSSGKRRAQPAGDYGRNCDPARLPEGATPGRANAAVRSR